LSGSGRRFIAELERRKVINSAGLYLGVAFIIMQVVEVVFPYARFPDAAGSIVLALLVVGFPIALGLSWVLEIKPPRLRRELPSAVAMDAGASVHGEVSTPKPLRPHSVVVLPFENLSDDPEDAYFSDGITDDIITSVGHIQDLRVLSRSSSMQYKGTHRSVGEIAEELGVATVVMGSVRRSGSRVRVMAEVIDARSDDHLWLDTFDRELEDIFQVQSELASKIAEVVRRELTSVDRERIEARGTNDPEAYDLYLRARFFWNQRSEAAVSESICYFQRALERDSGFAIAHSGLADAYTVLGIYGLGDPCEVYEAAGDAAEAALSIDPKLGEAIAARACISGIYDWEWTTAEEGFKRAIEIAPSYATAYQWYAVNLLVPRGRFVDARRQLELARELDWVSSAISISQGIVAFYSRDLETATKQFEDLFAHHSGFALVHLFLGQCYELAGRHASAAEMLQRSVDLSDESSEALAALAHCLGHTGRVPEAEAILKRLKERSGERYVSPALLAQVLIGLGRTTHALELLEEAESRRATDLIWIGVRPVYDPLRGSPRFKAIESRMGLT
jgi:TolB-like protein/Tfp pilus assembly protein PilF